MRPIKNTWYDWLIHYISKPIAKIVGGFKDKIVSLFVTNTPNKPCIRKERNWANQKIQNKRNPFIWEDNKKYIR